MFPLFLKLPVRSKKFLQVKIVEKCRTTWRGKYFATLSFSRQVPQKHVKQRSSISYLKRTEGVRIFISRWTSSRPPAFVLIGEEFETARPGRFRRSNELLSLPLKGKMSKFFLFISKIYFLFFDIWGRCPKWWSWLASISWGSLPLPVRNCQRGLRRVQINFQNCCREGHSPLRLQFHAQEFAPEKKERVVFQPRHFH